MLHAKAQYNWIQEVHLHVLHSNILFAANLQRDLTMIWSKASEPIGWSNNSLFVTQKNVTFPQLLQFSSWCCLYVPPTFFFPVGNWIPQTVNQTWKTIAILNLSKSSTPQNVAATPFFSWKMSWSFGDWDDWGPKKSARNPQHSDPPKISSQIFHQGSAPSILGTSLLKPKPHHFVSWKPKAQQKPEPNLWCFRFMLEEKMIPNNFANIPIVCLFFRTVPVSFFGNKHRDIHWHLGFYQNRSPYGFRKRCSKVFENALWPESLHSHPCYPKPIYGIQYNFTLPGTRSCESSSTRS